MVSDVDMEARPLSLRPVGLGRTSLPQTPPAHLNCEKWHWMRTSSILSNTGCSASLYRSWNGEASSEITLARDLIDPSGQIVTCDNPGDRPGISRRLRSRRVAKARRLSARWLMRSSSSSPAKRIDMLSGQRSCSQRVNADVARRSRRYADATKNRLIFERLMPTLRNRFGQNHRGSGGRFEFSSMMRLGDLDIEVAQGSRKRPDQIGDQRKCQAQIAGPVHRNYLGRFLQRSNFGGSSNRSPRRAGAHAAALPRSRFERSHRAG